MINISSSLLPFIKQEINKHVSNEKNLEESNSLSQIIENNSHSNLKEVKEYQELSLANENLVKNNSVKLNAEEYIGEKVIKVGEYYVKQTSLISSNMNNYISYPSQIHKNKSNSYLKVPGPGVLDKKDFEVKNNPQYVVDFVKDIFKCLQETEVC